jgi:hypothetical protein
MTPEGRVKNQVKRDYLIPNGIWYFMPVQAGFGARELDFICARGPNLFFIETKAPGVGRLTEPQAMLVRAHRAKGHPVFILDGTDEMRSVGSGERLNTMREFARFLESGEVPADANVR